MRLIVLVAFLSTFTLIAQDPATADDWRSWLNRGIEAYKSARYQEAVEDFQKAVYLRPNDVTPHLYLATAWMTQYIPGAESPENLGFQQKSETEFNRVLQLDPKNLTALQSLASLSYQQAQGVQNENEKFRKLDEAVSWYRRVLEVDPVDKTSYYSLGVIDWMKWYPNVMRARVQLGMRPEQPGPLPDASLRLDLTTRFSAIISDGIAKLAKALEIDPNYDDAMAYMNLFIRERADLKDTPEEWQQDVAVADEWVRKALATKRSKSSTYAAAPPPPPPPPAGSPQAPQRIRVGAKVIAYNLIRKVEPTYPILAEQARIQGTVRFTAVIGKDGQILDTTLISGHPLLIESARQALLQWEYRPTLLNGQPVEVISQMDVDFMLKQ